MMNRDANGWWVAQRPSEAPVVAQANAIERSRRVEAGESLDGFGSQAIRKPEAKRPRTRRAGISGRVARTRAGGEWTEAGMWGFMRSGFRRMSLRWPPIVRQALERARRRYSGTNKQQKWEYQCAECAAWFPRKLVAVDHVVPVGSLRSWDDVRGFLERLFVEVDGLRVACVGCHEIRTQRDRLNGSTPATADVVERVEFDGKNMPF